MSPHRVTLTAQVLDTFMLQQSTTSNSRSKISTDITKGDIDRSLRSSRMIGGETWIMNVAKCINNSRNTRLTAATSLHDRPGYKTKCADSRKNSNQNNKGTHQNEVTDEMSSNNLTYMISYK